MNLTRMREFQWVEYVVPIYKKYKLHITWGDQDIINIIFHFHPGACERLLLYCKLCFAHYSFMSIFSLIYSIVHTKDDKLYQTEIYIQYTIFIKRSS